MFAVINQFLLDDFLLMTGWQQGKSENVIRKVHKDLVNVGKINNSS